MKIIYVTNCPVSIAHTYLAAEKLEKTAKGTASMNSLPLFLLMIAMSMVVSMLMVIALKCRKQKKESAGKAT